MSDEQAVTMQLNRTDSSRKSVLPVCEVLGMRTVTGQGQATLTGTPEQFWAAGRIMSELGYKRLAERFYKVGL